MPELPEVETVRRDLEREVVGRRIRAVEATGSRSIRRHGDPASFSARLEGRRIVAVDRRGKYLLVRLEQPPADVLVVHLGMSGQLLWSPTGREGRTKHTHVVLAFESGAELRFLDPRTFGEVFVTAAADLASDVPELAHLGFDPLSQVTSWRHLGELLGRRRKKLKDLLMDQRFLAGIGNLYADEILWHARLRYDRAADALSPAEVRRLHRAITEVLRSAVEHRGSSLADEQYRDLYGRVGGFAAEHNVYDREGEPCPRCRRPIVRIKYGGRSHFRCDRCQR